MSEPETFTPERFIERAGWQEAARPFRAAHEYTLRGRTSAGVPPPPAEDHDAMIRHIAEHGYRDTFEGRTYTYLDVNGFTYWTSRAVFPPYHPIVNRRRNDG